jgi:hypothetical protein
VTFDMSGSGAVISVGHATDVGLMYGAATTRVVSVGWK